jgi:hypothetical protein
MFSGALLLLGVRATATYLERPVADRYVPFSYDLVAMAEMVDPATDAVIVDEFSGLTVTWLVGQPLPQIVRPGQPLPLGPDGRPTVTRVLARSVADLEAAVGEAAANAVPIAGPPDGQPSVWAVMFP